jgi:predicted Zn-dependent peptidase
MKRAEIRHRKTALPNGLEVVTVAMHDRPSISAGIWVKCGGRDEDARVNGVSHFIEHLVFKGTHNRSMRRIKEDTEGKGGSLNAFTSEEMTCYFAKAPARELDLTLDVLSDMVLHASMKPGDIEKERAVILEEIKMVNDQPAECASEIMDELFWKSDPLGRPLTGTEASMKRIRRRDILEYRKRHYTPDRIIVCAAGPVEHHRVVRWASRAFRGPVGRRAPHTTRPPRGLALKIVPKKIEQVHLILALPGLSKAHPDQYTLTLLNTVLGGNMSSRLFNEVREERGLAYEIGSHTKRLDGVGVFSIEAGVDASKTAQALKAICGQCARLKKQPVGAAEFGRAREYVLGQIRTGLENTLDVMLWAGEDAITYGRVREISEIERGIRKTTPRGLQSLARRILSGDALHTVVLGPVSASQKAQFSRVLGF